MLVCCLKNQSTSYQLTKRVCVQSVEDSYYTIQPLKRAALRKVRLPALVFKTRAVKGLVRQGGGADYAALP